MKRGWHMILGIVVVAIVLGAICFGVGILTGAETDRIVQNMDEQFHLTSYVEAYTNYIVQLWNYFTKLV